VAVRFRQIPIGKENRMAGAGMRLQAASKQAAIKAFKQF
jgi:hypothetical protein